MSDGQSFKESPFSISSLWELNCRNSDERVRTAGEHRNWHKWIPRECANEEEEEEEETPRRVVDRDVKKKKNRCGKAL